MATAESEIIRTRAHGAMLGLAVGDALGWPVEDRGGRVGGTAKLRPEFNFMRWRRREGGRFAPHEQVVDAGEYSDDTQLALAVARSRTTGDDWWRYLTEVELPLWTVYERGGGGATKRAAQAWLHGHAPWEDRSEVAVQRYFAAGGNGAVMRCLAHCLVWPAHDPQLRNQSLDLDALTTHGHPRALLGSRLYAAAIDWALRRDEPLPYGGLIDRLLATSHQWGMPPTLPDALLGSQPRDYRLWEEEWIQALEETMSLLRVSGTGLAQGAVAVDKPVLEDLGAFGPNKGAGNVTAVAAIFLVSRYASQPQQGLLAAAFARGSDTDTIASLTAALLGALHGPEWLAPLTDHVQDSGYIVNLTDQLLREKAASKADRPWTRTDRSNLYRWLETASVSDRVHLSAFGEAAVTAVRDHEAKSMFVRSWDMETEIGQTVQIKRYERGRDGHPKWGALSSPVAIPEAVEPPRAGLVLQVADIRRSQRFYEDVIGLKIQRATDEYVSFGWLALERADPGEPPVQLTIPSRKQTDGQMIRVYLAEKSLDLARQRVGELGLPVTRAHPRFHGRAFRCTDPDGHVVELVARNGRPPVISV
jgi:ADP-ribosylglycohydrolase/catechol 2,3-dioxygenase-like lactoylglutathione lyase family enzyme